MDSTTFRISYPGANPQFVVCKHCGHVNQDRLYCEKCSRPLSDEMLKDWLLQKYFENLVLNAEYMEEVVGAYRDAKVGEVTVDYLIEYKDGSKTVLMTMRSEEVVRRLIEYNREKKEKIKVVFLSVTTAGSPIPRIDDRLVIEASKYNIEVEYFEIMK